MVKMVSEGGTKDSDVIKVTEDAGQLQVMDDGVHGTLERFRGVA